MILPAGLFPYSGPERRSGKRRFAIRFHKHTDKLEFGGLSNSRSLRTSPQIGVAISWIGVQFLVEEFRKTAGKNGLYDDRSLVIRWRFPHQCAHWFGMTRYLRMQPVVCSAWRTINGTIPSGAGQKRLHISCARLGRPPCGQIPICRVAA